MKTFKVEVLRVSYVVKTFEVQANTEDEAEEIATELAYNAEFREAEAEYLINYSDELN